MACDDYLRLDCSNVVEEDPNQYCCNVDQYHNEKVEEDQQIQFLRCQIDHGVEE